MSVVSVVGAAGIIGPAIVATLAEHDAINEIRCLDMDAEGAARVATAHGQRQGDLRGARHPRPRLGRERAARLDPAAQHGGVPDQPRRHGGRAGGRRALPRPRRPVPRHERAARARRALQRSGIARGARHGIDPGQDQRDGRAGRRAAGRTGRPDRGRRRRARPEAAVGAARGALRGRDDPRRALDAEPRRARRPGGLPRADVRRRRRRVRRSRRPGVHDLHDPLRDGDLPPLVRRDATSASSCRSTRRFSTGSAC